MDTTPRKRVVKGVLLNTLQRYRETAHLPHDKFEAANADYPRYLRDMAEAYELAPSEMHVEERPGFAGYDEWSHTYDDEDDNPVIRGEEAALGELSNRYPATTVLDFGAGTGRHAIPYARAGARVTALEPGEQMIAAARAKADAEGLEIEFRQIDLHAPLEDNRVFALVLCCLVLSHVGDLTSAIRVLSGRVAMGGRLIITDFHPYNLLVGMRTSYAYAGQKYYVPNYIHLPSEYVRLANAEGMKLEDFHESGEIRGYPGMPATISLVFHREES